MRGRTGAVETDWSQAAFWYGANLLGGQVEILDLNRSSAQGTCGWSPIPGQLARPGDVALDVSQCPDLVPPLAAMAAVRTGECRIMNAARLRLKESDRLATVTQTLRALGAAVEEGPDSLTFHGLPILEGGVTVDCCNDHRIAHDGRRGGLRLPPPDNAAGGGVREQVLSRLLGGLSSVRRGSG